MYQPRAYRHWIKDGGLVSFQATVKETDLYLRAQRDLKRQALRAIEGCRAPLERYIERYPQFLTALQPLPVAEDAPKLVREMAEAAQRTGVGPMAAVAGAIAEAVGRELMRFSSEVIVENGGDIFLSILQPRLVGVYAGEAPFTGKIALNIEPEDTPLGICTSSGTVGHSLSFGRADAVIVLSPCAALADAAATAIGNLIKMDSDIPKAIEFAQGIQGVSGVLIIIGSKMGAWGKVKLTEMEQG